MEAQLSNYLTNTKDKRNYLCTAQTSNHVYLQHFEGVYKTYLRDFNRDVEIWLRDKMLLNEHTFDEKQFIQYACEATIVKYYADRFKSNLEIEKRLNPPSKKDVDLSFSVDDFNFNVEIKCSDFKQKELIDANNTLKVQTIGRHPDLAGVMSDLGPILQEVAKKLNKTGVEVAKNMDNNLKDFLKSANEKFSPTASEKDLNVLAVSCDDAEDMQLWYYYMFMNAGLFTANSFCSHADYENVDIVLLNNLYFKHHRFLNKRISNSWDFEQCFNLVLINPFSKNRKDAAIQKFLEITPNLNTRFKPFAVAGEADAEVKDSRRIAHFIKAQLEEKDQIFLFEQPS